MSKTNSSHISHVAETVRSRVKMVSERRSIAVATSRSYGAILAEIRIVFRLNEEM